MKLSLFSVPDHHPGRGRSIAQFYAELLAEAELADALGYDTYFVAEHHFHHYGIVPDPAVMLSAMAQRTRRLRLGTAVSVLPFRNPLNTAESYAMVDALSGGRLTLGVGSGYLAHEFAGFGVDAAAKRERFEEALSVLERLLAGERVSWSSPTLRIDNLAINVLPVQQGGVPITVATLSPASAYQVGRNGRALSTVPYAALSSFEEIAKVLADYRRGRAEAAAAGVNARIHPMLDDEILMFHAHVAETDEEARILASGAFDLYVETRLFAKKAVYADIMRSGLSLMGGVETVVAKLLALDALGVRHVMTMHDFGLLPAADVHRSMRLMAQEVMPRLERAKAAKAAASRPAAR